MFPSLPLMSHFSPESFMFRSPWVTGRAPPHQDRTTGSGLMNNPLRFSSHLAFMELQAQVQEPDGQPATRNLGGFLNPLHVGYNLNVGLLVHAPESASAPKMPPLPSVSLSRRESNISHQRLYPWTRKMLGRGGRSPPPQNKH